MLRGIRQGCPISAILYLFVADILALKIKNNDQIIGIKTSNFSKEYKHVHHADDLTLFLKNIDSLKEALKTIKDFSKRAGSRLNVDKTECILTGGLQQYVEKIEGIKINTSTVKCLGIHIGTNKDECYKNNWVDKSEKMKKLFETWKKRKLTIFGKTEIINTLGISKFLYVASILPLPNENIIKGLNRTIFNFLWGTKDRIKRKTMIGKIEDGGIGIVDILSKFCALKAAWIPRILKKDGHNLIYSHIDSILKTYNVNLEYVLKMNCTDLKQFNAYPKLPIFYREVFIYFNQCKKILICQI